MDSIPAGRYVLELRCKLQEPGTGVDGVDVEVEVLVEILLASIIRVSFQGAVVTTQGIP